MIVGRRSVLSRLWADIDRKSRESPIWGFNLEKSHDQFHIDTIVPLENPDFTSTAETLLVLEGYIRLAVLLAFLDEAQINKTIPSLLRTYNRIPLRVRSIGISSIKINIEGDPDEI